jgi:hypothetical protein
MNKSTTQIVLQYLTSIAMIVVFVFLVYNVIDGLMYATTVQGFSGVMLLIFSLTGLVVAITNLHKLFG